MPGKTGPSENGKKVRGEIGEKLVEHRQKIGRICKHVGGKTANGYHA